MATNFLKRAFTLIELLTVIAVIGIIAAILIPVVSSVRMSAKETQAMSNLRQLGLAYLGVAQDNKGQLPAWNNLEEGGTGEWVKKVNVYLGGDENYEVGKVASAFKDPSAIARGLINENAVYHFAPLGGITRGGGSRLGPYRRLVNYRIPGRQILLADAGVDATTLNPSGDLYRVDGGFQSWEGFSNPNIAGDGTQPIAPGDGEAGNIRWFGGRAKFFFLDGHVEKRSQKDVLKRNVNPLYP